MTTATPPAIIRLPVDGSFTIPADDATIDRTADSLRARGFEVEVVADGATARDLVLSRIPVGSEVNSGASVTLKDIGVTEVLEGSGDYDAMRPRIRAMDRKTEGRTIRKLGAAPDYFVNSAQAVTVDGRIVIVSFGGSQLAPIVSGAGQVVLVVGSQKIVPDLDTAFRRVETYAYPLEDVRLEETYGIRSAINKVLILNGEFQPGRILVVLVREPLGA